MWLFPAQFSTSFNLCVKRSRNSPNMVFLQFWEAKGKNLLTLLWRKRLTAALGLAQKKRSAVQPARCSSCPAAPSAAGVGKASTPNSKWQTLCGPGNVSWILCCVPPTEIFPLLHLLRWLFLSIGLLEAGTRFLSLKVQLLAQEVSGCWSNN